MIDYTDYFSGLQLAGIVFVFFGMALVILAGRRRRLRGRIQGLQRFALTDRAPFTRKAEMLIIRFGLFLASGGVLLIIIMALRQETQIG
jgi:hypothetical protein